MPPVAVTVGVWYSGKDVVDCVVVKLQVLPPEEEEEREEGEEDEEEEGEDLDRFETDDDCGKVVARPVEVLGVRNVDSETELDFELDER